MSLKELVKSAEVVTRFKPLRPKLSRKIGTPIRVPARTRRYALLGTAFDYLFRFELQRLVPEVKSDIWTAEHAVKYLHRVANFGLHVADIKSGKLEADIVGVVSQAKFAVACYSKLKSPTSAETAVVAAHAIRLGRLEPIVRAGVFDPDFESVDPSDVEELLALLSAVPFSEFLGRTPLILNPRFGESSSLVGGADADLIMGNILLDLKVTTKDSMDPLWLDQLLGYFLLSRREHKSDSSFPQIGYLGFYFCRHAHLWTLPTTTWTERAGFAETEEWFFSYARRLFPPRAIKNNPSK